MTRLVTIFEAHDPSGRLLWTVRNRRDLEAKLGYPATSRNDNPFRWQVSDPSAVDSLRDADEVSSGISAGLRLYFRFERVSSGNSKQRHAARRKAVKAVSA